MVFLKRFFSITAHGTGKELQVKELMALPTLEVFKILVVIRLILDRAGADSIHDFPAIANQSDSFNFRLDGLFFWSFHSNLPNLWLLLRFTSFPLIKFCDRNGNVSRLPA